MPEALSPGWGYEATYVVTPEMSPPHIGGILSTPRLVGLVEDTCLEALALRLAEDRTTVGTEIHLRHVGTGLAGDEVRVAVELVKVTRGRLLRFEVEVEGPAGLIASGMHQRLVVDRSRFGSAGPAPV